MHKPWVQSLIKLSKWTHQVINKTLFYYSPNLPVLLLLIMSLFPKGNHYTGIKIVGRNINNLRYADEPPLWQKVKEELKSLLMKVKVESEKVGLRSTFRKQRSWHLVPSLHGKSMGKQCQTLFLGAPKSLQMVIAAMKLKDAYSLEEKLWPT